MNKKPKPKFRKMHYLLKIVQIYKKRHILFDDLGFLEP